MMATPAKDIKPSADRDDGGGARDYNSDSSIEEIPESSFKQRIGKGNPNPKPNPNLIGGEGGGTMFSHRTHRSVSTANANNRAWKGGDAALHHSQQYPNINNTNFTSNLYNFAWAQAVQNKPLGFSNQPSAIVPNEHCIVLDDEQQREEGELEEGEIGDLDSEELELQGECDSKDQNNDGEEKAEHVMVVEEGSPHSIEDNNDGPEIIEVEEDDDSDDGGDNHDDDDADEKMDDFDIRLITIIEELEILPEDVEKSFDDACSQMHKALEKLKKIVLDGPLDVVIQQAFIGVQTIHSVFLKRKEQHRYVFKRLLEYIERQKPKLFSSEQMKEIYSMLQSASPDHITDSIPLIETKQIFSRDSNGESTGLPLSKSCKLESLIIPKNRFEFKPLLDPRANHDEGSLPSPTHETAYPSLIQRSIYSGSNVTASQPTTCRREETSYGSKTAVYETDALRAVCSYQKKYDRISYLSENRLPSPTPSDESNNVKIDSHSEVSSITNNKTISSFGVDNSKNITSGFRPGLHHSSYISNSDAKVSSKSRDPRLRIANLNTVNSQDFNKQPATIGYEASKNGFPGDIVMDSRKQNIINGYSINCQSMKRQKYDCSGYTNPQMASIGKAGYLEKHNINTTLRTDNNHPMEVMGQGKLSSNVNSDAYTRQDIHGHIKRENIQKKNIQSMDAVSKVSFPALLKEITTNPTMLIHLLKEQHRLTAEGQQKSANLNQDATNSMAVFSPNIYIKSSETEEKVDAKSQSIFQLTMSEAGKPRMKPRDPRRILHNNMVKKIESLGSESVPSLNANGRDSIIVREQGEKQQISGMPSQTQSIQDITSQFVNNKKNVVDTMSTKQNNPAVAFHPINSQPVSKSANNASSIQRSTEVSMPATSQLPNQWGDVDYLLDGYDDKQKAAIQRERARRIEEQSKMFSARKLCLVLDLDHTLLNSAKFVEVDQFHDEILRTKEEQDRDQPQRHLYRFQHMAMWTKLRPGVWNFLEKASKLFELHLYTMGNNVYATEMAKILDPKGALFAGRVISKGDDGDSPDGDDRLPKSKDLDGVLGMESAVVIIDDSIRVWPHHKLNLIVVERYMYFPSSRRQFGLPGPSLLEIDRDERPEDGSLASSLAVIERIHQNFFSRPSLNNVDVRNILAAEQHKILGGCRIVFSRIFPVGEINPQRHPLWQTAEQFGAICTNQLDDQVTHVVTNSPGTNKVNWALSMGKFVVYPGWVESSALLYRRASEHDFSVSKL